MKFYRVALVSANCPAGSGGFDWSTTKREAARLKDENDKREQTHGAYPTSDWVAEIEMIEITPTNKGILDALKMYARHPDNG